MNYRLQKALNVIEGYCWKHDRCDEKCDLFVNDHCLVQSIAPCDYSTCKVIQSEREVEK